MKLYLSSYKLGNEVDELKKWIQTNGNEIAFIFNARDVYPESEHKKESINRDIKELQDVGFDVKVIDLKNYFDNDRLSDDLKKFKAFFVIGGNTFALRKAMELSGFDNYLLNISKMDNYLYGGYSAGICVLSKTLEGLSIVDEPINPYNDDKINYNGIGLIDYTLIPHYKSVHPESYLVDKTVEYFDENNLPYKTLQDGDVFITDTLNNKKEITGMCYSKKKSY